MILRGPELVPPSSPTVGAALERHHHKSFESEFYRLFKIYLEPGDRS